MQRTALIALAVTVLLAVAGFAVGGHNVFWPLFWIALAVTVLLGMFLFVRWLLATTTKRHPKY